MLREFFNTSTEQSFLKALLSAALLPKFSIVNKDDLIFKDYFYIYNRKIIQCTKTGLLDQTVFSVDDATLGESTLNDYNNASYVVLSHYNPFTENQNLEFKEFIRASYYSTEEHKRLGDYLRFMRDFYHIDLMGMYNCFSYEMFNKIHIKEKVVDDELNLELEYDKDSNKKILAIPVKFNKTYTIAIESNTPVYYSLVFKFSSGIKRLSAVSSLEPTDDLVKPKSLGLLKFNTPVTISTLLTNELGELYKYNDYLYLIILLDVSNNSSLAVLEGDYTRSNAINVVSSEYSNITDTVSLIYKPSLLKFNDGNQYAYSNLIIPYLIRNVIDNNDLTSTNITYVKSLLGFSDDVNYWDNSIKYVAYLKYLFNSYLFEKDDDGYLVLPDKVNYKNNDITGYIDSTIERWLNALE